MMLTEQATDTAVRERPAAAGEALAGGSTALRGKRVPGSVAALKAKLFWRILTSRDLEHLRRYHYLGVLYPHHRAVEDIFRALDARYGGQPACNGYPAEVTG